MTAPTPLRPELRRLLVPVYFPWAMATLGAGVLLPVLPLYLEQSGLRLSFVGLVTASAGIGSALGGLPASSLAERRGTDRLLAVALILMAGTAAVLGATDAVVGLVVLRVAYGFGHSGISQSRQLVVARSVEIGLRGRVNSWIGGTHRLMFVIGPLVGGLVYDRWGEGAAFSLAGGLTALGLAFLILPGGRDDHPVSAPAERTRIGPSLWRHRRRLAMASLGPFLVMSARQGRHVVVPLIGVELDLDPVAIGVLVAAGTTADFLLFPISGYIMDRWGRLMSMVPAFSLMAAGLAMLGLADSVSQAVVAGIVIGVGNGMSSGTMLTLSTDLAPPEEPGPFIAGFQTLSAAGSFSGPLLVGWVADIYGLGTAAIALAVTLAAGVVWIALVIGETGKRNA
jgi:MFS family permease